MSTNVNFQRDSTLAHHECLSVCNTVKLLERETSNFTSFEYGPPQQPRGEPNCL